MTRRLVAAVLATAVLVVCATNCAMTSRAAELTFDGPTTAPARPWAIVPGAGVHADGTPSDALKDRLDCAVALYQTGRVSQVFVSGDGGSNDEDGTMAGWLVARGVPASAIVRDPVGYRTRTTMEDAAARGITGAIVCTQDFHLARSLAWARHEGIDAVGVVADDRWHDHQVRARMRETFARTVAFVEML